MMEKKKILFLYTELARYFLASVGQLLASGRVEVHIVRWAVNKEAPFRFQFDPRIHIYDRDQYDGKALAALAEQIDPDAIVCSGWIDRDYVKICQARKKKSVTIITLDNKWRGSFRQQVARIISPFTLKRIFHYAWVPGKLQQQYAGKLGFSMQQVRTGFYSADTDFFSKQYAENQLQKAARFPHRFLYVGRYYEFKGLAELWEAFVQLKAEDENDWELWCLGTGDMKPVEHPAIRHFGFVQPEDLGQYLAGTGVFVMPSRVEPWGVVLHEFAAAGFPLLCSNNVGAVSQFVREGENGFIFSAGNTGSIKKVLRKIISCSDEELNRMGKQSAAKALEITPQTWAGTLLGMIG
ncbi:MAG: glycosyl transferase family 1 [Bacteroidetes bacterium]|nr:MAG: glycosyl transferase family 1 [Bacteroidota bacterium]